MSEPAARFDGRFSDPAAEATPWTGAEAALASAELYWLTTVRADGRPHVTPLIGVHHDGAVHFCTGSGEQKARNLEHSAKVALTTGTNTWAAGLDIVVEGEAVRITDTAKLQELADAIEAKYGEVWHFDVAGDAFDGQAEGQATCSASSRRRSWPSPRTRTVRPASASADRRTPLTARAVAMTLKRMQSEGRAVASRCDELELRCSGRSCWCSAVSGRR